jgi:hypothetical protein
MSCCGLQDAFKLAMWGSLEGPPAQKKAAAAGTKRKAAEDDVSAGLMVGLVAGLLLVELGTAVQLALLV